MKEIKNKVGDKVFLVLHGGSGVPEEDIKEAIESGIVKININTELRLAFTNTLKKILEENPKETTPYKYMPKVIEEVQKGYLMNGKVIRPAMVKVAVRKEEKKNQEETKNNGKFFK